jgi:hypothetical protein
MFGNFFEENDEVLEMFDIFNHNVQELKWAA